MKKNTLISVAVALALVGTATASAEPTELTDTASANNAQQVQQRDVNAQQALRSQQTRQQQRAEQRPKQRPKPVSDDVEVDQPQEAPISEVASETNAFDVTRVKHLLSELSAEQLQSDTANQLAAELVERIDSLRGYADQGFSFELSNVSYRRVRRSGEESIEKRENSLHVSVLGEESLVKFLTPARDKGRLILKSGRNMWLYIPGTSKTLRITPAQRLIGEASNGDVTGTNFGAEYTPTLSNVSLDNDKPTVEVTLTANSRSVTYSKIVFTLSLDELLPIRSDYFSISGKKVKRAEYVEFKPFAEQLKIHKMRLIDPINADRVTWLMFDKYQLEDINPAIFNADSLSRL